MGNFLFWGALSGALAVMLGAFGAHALKSRLTPDMLTVYQTAVEYHFYHTGALLVVGLLALTAHSDGWLIGSGVLFLLGVLLFSGSLYILALSGVKLLGMITPIGGLCLIAGWVCLTVYAARVLQP